MLLPVALMIILVIITLCVRMTSVDSKKAPDNEVTETASEGRVDVSAIFHLQGRAIVGDTIALPQLVTQEVGEAKFNVSVNPIGEVVGIYFDYATIDNYDVLLSTQEAIKHIRFSEATLPDYANSNQYGSIIYKFNSNNAIK